MKIFSSEIHRAFAEQILSILGNKFSEKDWQQFTGKFLSLIPVSDRLIFCCGNLILHLKKKWKWEKQFFK